MNIIDIQPTFMKYNENIYTLTMISILILMLQKCPFTIDFDVTSPMFFY